MQQPEYKQINQRGKELQHKSSQQSTMLQALIYQLTT